MNKLYEIPEALYLHIPYCRRKCPYCDFYSIAGEPVEAFVDAILCELEAWAEDVGTVPLRSVYFGGGTPSRLKTDDLVRILQFIEGCFGLHSEAEITLEMNPEDLDHQELKRLREVGYNRLSLGLQTTEDQALRKLGRLHGYEGFLDAYEAAQVAGFKNLSLDLILGLPFQTLQEVEQDLERVLALRPQHISCYSLIIEEGTPFGARYTPGEPPLPDDDLERTMVHLVADTLKAAGYNHYEISNFALGGFESIHNSHYWDILPYFAVGPGAAAFVNGKRLHHEPDVSAYLETWSSGGSPFERLSVVEDLSIEDAATELVIFQLRRLDRGFVLSNYEERFGPLAPRRLEVFKHYEALGMCEKTGDGWRLTGQGADYADALARELL